MKRTVRTNGRHGNPGRRFSYAQLASLGLGMVIAIGLQIAFSPRGPVHPVDRSAPLPVTSRGPHPGIRLAEGSPWGELESTSIALERPDELSSGQNDPVQKTVWHFQGYTMEKLAGFLESIGLDESNRKILLDPPVCKVETNSCVVEPPLPLILSLSPAVRQNLYSELARDPANFDQRFPFLYRVGRFDEWFSESGLPSDKVDLIERLSYTNANALCFADIEPFRSISSSNENYLLIKALSRVSTELVGVRVAPGNVPHLLDYWGRGRREVLKPLLESLTRAHDSRLGVSFMLPSFARLRLYTYPDPLKDPNASREDCYWSSMNFFSGTPDARFFDFAQILRALQNEYVTVQDRPAAFGDVILFRDAKAESVHMCVYIADDIVFTKNGAHYFQPWVLMRYADVLARYPDAIPSQTQLFRRRFWVASGITK